MSWCTDCTELVQRTRHVVGCCGCSAELGYESGAAPFCDWDQCRCLFGGTIRGAGTTSTTATADPAVVSTAVRKPQISRSSNDHQETTTNARQYWFKCSTTSASTLPTAATATPTPTTTTSATAQLWKLCRLIVSRRSYGFLLWQRWSGASVERHGRQYVVWILDARDGRLHFIDDGRWCRNWIRC